MLMLAFFALLITTAVAAPTPSSNTPACNGKTFDKPWILTDISVWEPTEGAVSKTGQITFHFCDKNNGLELEADCVGQVMNGTCGGDDGGYVTCENEDVAFKLDAGELLMERAFIDDCLGPYPYNSGIAFGQNATKMLTEGADGPGSMSTQSRMLVHITQMT